MAKQTQQFQTEIKQLLDLMVHSLYSHREIFLRELISNASDAIDKRRFEAITNSDLTPNDGNYEIRLIADEKANILKIIDNGIGMTYDEVIENIGTIAKSGSKNYLQAHKELAGHPELIGQFGVGFYSAFMVAEKVVLHTQKAGTTEGVIWESTGDGSYTIDHVPRPEGGGTSVILYLKKAESEDKDSSETHEHQNFSEEWTLKSLIRKYSDFISHPIRMLVKKEVPKKDDKGEVIKDQYETVEEDETLNSQKALWLRSTNEIKDEEYKEFYHHICHDWNAPLKTIHYKAEGTLEYHALMFIPEKRPWNYNYRDQKNGLNLYVKRVFIMDNCEDLIPPYLRFVKGMIDSNDLSLNVSREILQKDRQVTGIRKAITGKILNILKEMKEKDLPTYEKFWQEFGPTLKEGISIDPSNKEKLQELFLFHSTHSDKLTTLKDYVERMKSEQKQIYFISGEDIHQIRNSPFLEKLKDKGYEVLLLTDPIDEWVVDFMREYQGKQLQSITRENLDLDTEEERKKKEDELKDKKEKLSPLLETIRNALTDKIKDVKISDRLTDSAACLVSGANDPSARMERLLDGLGNQQGFKAKRILEINPSHPVINQMFELSTDVQKQWAEILYSQALLTEGGTLADPTRFAKQINELMVQAADRMKH